MKEGEREEEGKRRKQDAEGEEGKEGRKERREDEGEGKRRLKEKKMQG